MKNRNTKDVAENHIYSFLLSNLSLFVAIFFSLNSASEVAILFYALALNLFTHWFLFYTSRKKKMIHFSEYYNNLMIGIYCVAASIPVFLLIFPLLFMNSVSNPILLLLSWILSFLIHTILIKRYGWESQAEQLFSEYRMNISEKREEAFEKVKEFIDQSDPKKCTDYLNKSELFDERIEAYIKE
ncbi:hypothetical protein [Ancylomarina longa]|uniref:Uncharacterized protein n=1 Tax=Ancylomarina longa TaxID=2487017 RepID=A0A434AVE4_9BACT|nr:hypothetical protein [Ancylomarina longa]RUT78457.1 hypothetical protein DLK05_07720 [Ancylomarina longa]